MAGRKANYGWVVGPSNAAFASTAASATSFQDVVMFEKSVTIQRIIVDAYFQIGSVADAVAAVGRVGIIVADPQVVAVGATAMNRPTTDGDQEWLWNRAYGLRQESDGTGKGSFTPLHLHDDVRAKRRVKQNDHLVWVAQNDASGAVLISVSMRILFAT